MLERMNQNLLSLSPSGIRRFTALARQSGNCAMLTIGEPDFDTPAPVKEAAKRALDGNRTHYPMNAGDPDVRWAVSEYERVHCGLNYGPDEVLMTCGASEAIYTAMTGVLNPGDEVILPMPAFGLYESIARLAGAKIVYLDTHWDRFQIDPDRLRSLITPKTKLLVLNSPNNPTGVCYTRQTLEGIYQIVSQTPMFVLCDDVYQALAYQSFPSFSAYTDLKRQLLVVKSFSKPYAMTGWRLGYLLADAPILERLKLLHASAVVSVAAFSQDACIQALKTDVSGMLETYRKRRDQICLRLEAMGLHFIRPEGAFYVFPSIRKFGMSSEDFVTRMIQRGGVAGIPGSCFGADGYLRFSFCYSSEEIELAMDRFEKYIKTLKI